MVLGLLALLAAGGSENLTDFLELSFEAVVLAVFKDGCFLDLDFAGEVFEMGSEEAVDPSFAVLEGVWKGGGPNAPFCWVSWLNMPGIGMPEDWGRWLAGAPLSWESWPNMSVMGMPVDCGR